MIKTVSVQELCEQLETDPQAVLIDLRRPVDFELGHVPQARNIPLGSMSLAQMLAEWSREAEGKPLYFICQAGGRSQQILDELDQMGYHSAQCVAGGMVAWQAMGLPVEINTQATPEFNRERRMRLITGFLVLLGCALGLGIHKGFFAIPVMVAAEMILAGFTGWSGLASVFGRKDREG
jgi:rhodanese-related sulfurtransferase